MLHQMNALLQFSSMEEKKIALCGEKNDAVQGGGSELLKTFIGELDAVYAQTSQVMREAEFKISSKLEYKPQRTLKDGIEFFTAQTLPKYRSTSMTQVALCPC
ncbi:hypothetical protein V7S43_004106 [Phytophthora oleae]|uniref:FH2 domain-containing protein n=1 Tax=Phytophthora oleae TaxID=2107226 RepID=A0ABD3FX85_9STRA